MCIAFFALQHPDYALVLCGNRDEYLARPTRPADFHLSGDQHVLSGVDIQAGGTWLGLSRSGYLALLTNITEPPITVASSRGHLASAFLTAGLDALQPLIQAHTPYAGFNLLLFTPTPSPPLAFDALYLTNHGAGNPITQRALSDAERLHGALSNGIDGRGADEWPNIQHGLDAFKRLLDTLPAHTPDDQLADRLFDLLTWRSSEPPRDRSELKNTIGVDPIRLGDAAALYATRLSTVVLVHRDGHVLFIERDRWQLTAPERPCLADPSSQRVFRFRLESSR